MVSELARSREVSLGWGEGSCGFVFPVSLPQLSILRQVFLALPSKYSPELLCRSSQDGLTSPGPGSLWFLTPQ